MKATLKVILVAVVSAPVALVLTLTMLPIWRWFEGSTGIESIGHSGPASWCYVANYAMVMAIAIIFSSDINVRSTD